ncbi:hypothetical protein [Crocosphaera chwakensis]|uniref:hypothetical protein n=1 Tax=Crocosphaera chwakensis TaxID=2546361 RepID=UPI001E493EA0|nr:hypothetical protein [Crocosphaera chwakensis]
MPETTLSKIKTVRWDRIIEKHEGPEDWASVFRYSEPEFMQIEGRWVLLHVDSSSHDNITILRTIWSEDSNTRSVLDSIVLSLEAGSREQGAGSRERGEKMLLY